MKSKKKKLYINSIGEKQKKTDMVLGKKVAIFDWEWALEKGRKSPECSS